MRKNVRILKMNLDIEIRRVYNNTPDLWKGDLVCIDRSLKTEKGEEPFNNIAVEADVANNEKKLRQHRIFCRILRADLQGGTLTTEEW